MFYIVSCLNLEMLSIIIVVFRYFCLRTFGNGFGLYFDKFVLLGKSIKKIVLVIYGFF